jgi:aerobic carbon-monoxide dehydrogenase medium subunit
LRDLPAAEFFQGMFTTALASDEMVTHVRFAIPKRAAYAKFRHPASGYAMTGVLVADYGGQVRVAVTGAGPGVFRWTQAEAALTQQFAATALAGLHYPADELNADLHAPAAYRAQLMRVLTLQAVARCLSAA